MDLIIGSDLAALMGQDFDNGGISQIYSNYFEIGYNAAEFLLDFGQSFEDTEARFFERIIMSPAHAKALSHMFERSIRGYEQTFGPILEDVDK